MPVFTLSKDDVHDVDCMHLHTVICTFAIGMMFVGAGSVYGKGSVLSPAQAASASAGQAYPHKPIRVVTAEPGGGLDFAARLIALQIAGPLGQPVIVDNRPVNRTPEQVARSTPDGYTLLFAGGSFALAPLLYDNLSYDAVKDFAPISLLTSAPSVLVVHPSVPANSVRELIALAKAKPGELNYASAATGSSNHLSAELFKAMAGINIVRVNYKGTGLAINDVMGGRVQLMFVSGAGAAPHVKAGKLRALASTGMRPSALLPELPTVAASGLPGYESGTTVSILAPAKTPGAIVDRLNQEIVRIANRADIKEKFFVAGTEIVGSSPQQLGTQISTEIARLGKVIKDAGIRAE